VIFDSNRPGGLGGFDIYRAIRASTADPWSVPVNLNSLNSTASDGGKMSLPFDGTQLYFRSNRLGHFDLYVATWEKLRY
jgi:Tol biopolymer transport system component